MIERSQQGKRGAEIGLQDHKTTGYETGQPPDRSWPTLRAERAKPKSRRDDVIIAQGKQGTSAALGYRSKMTPGCGVALTQGGGFACAALRRALP